MARPTSKWLLEPTFPAAPPLPRLDRELLDLAEMSEPPCDSEIASTHHQSGTWLLGSGPERDDADVERFATSASDAPTVRPGSLHAEKTG